MIVRPLHAGGFLSGASGIWSTTARRVSIRTSVRRPFLVNRTRPSEAISYNLDREIPLHAAASAIEASAACEARSALPGARLVFVLVVMAVGIPGCCDTPRDADLVLHNQGW